MTIKNFAPCICYGGMSVGGDIALEANGKGLIGYGYSGSPNSQCRAVQEITAGWTPTIWRVGKYGALQEMVQHAYCFRNPWYVAPGFAQERR